MGDGLSCPFTMRRLESDGARVDELDPNFTSHESIEAANHDATLTSTAKGLNGELMKVMLNCTACENEHRHTVRDK